MHSTFGDITPVTPMTKILLSVGIYLSLVFVLGFVLALSAKRENYPQDFSEDEG